MTVFRLRIAMTSVLNMKAFFAKYGLLFVVFVTGACVLVVEIVATRILSPYFGNTIFTVSSVITVILAALSIGSLALVLLVFYFLPGL